MEENVTKEILAKYGLAMPLAQGIEKGIINLTLIQKVKLGINQSRFDELLYEKSQMTFGQLKRELPQLNIFSEAELNDLNTFHANRDLLAHTYWWNKSVESADPASWYLILEELNSFIDFFNKLDECIVEKSLPFYETHGIDLIAIEDELMSQGKTPAMESFRNFSKNETIEDIFGLKNHSGSIIPIFRLTDGSHCTVCEDGLTNYTNEIVEVNKVPISKLEGIFPIHQFNPKPKVETPWQYELDLKKKGLKMIIQKDGMEQPVRWRII